MKKAVWSVNQAENWSKKHNVKKYTGHELASEKSYGDNRCTAGNLMMKSTILSHQIDFLSFPGHVYDQKHRKLLFQKTFVSKTLFFLDGFPVNSHAFL